MNNKKYPAFTWMDWLLLAAIAGLFILLLTMLAGPAIEWWRNRPRPGAQVRQRYVGQELAGKEGVTTWADYLLYLPPKYNTDRQWPLVVFLHGAGDRGQDLEIVRRAGLPRQIEEGEQFEFILLSPQCPANRNWSPELIVELIEHISGSLSVDRDRVYLTGLSMGGFGTWRTASYEPNRFAAIAPVCGGGDVTQAERLKNVPIWAFHGDKDTVVPLKASQEMVDAVKKCGGQVKFTVYSGGGHGIWDQTYRDKEFFEWLLAQRRSHSLKRISAAAKEAFHAERR